MGVTAVCGINWGDEGKGRMVDYFAGTADYIVRFQGGNNAGHTVMNSYGKFALHLLPSGIFNKKAMNIIGNGAVINPEALYQEIIEIEKVVGKISNLMISERSHIVFPFHILLDEYEEERLQDKMFGSTKRGIAPVYSDKYLKVGILASDLLNKDYLAQRIKTNLEFKNKVITDVYKKAPVNADEMIEWGWNYGQKIKEYISNTILVLRKAVNEDKKILLEGQLGALRDIEFGIYPYTTSSSPIPGYASAGSSIPPYAIKRVTGVMKAYSSCVGEGPFVSELFDDVAETIRTVGKEFGASTGRSRRIGWFDAVASRYGCEITAATELALTLLDVLSGHKELKICDAYEIDGEYIYDFPTTEKLYKAKPRYITMKGWDEDVTAIREYSQLPENARKYIEKIEEMVGVKIKYVSVGPERDQLIKR
ncbi:MAG: adenylosuccinate synthase [Spirochaetes bacterium GWF1_31_7]|nr:MAG: adenylosuccinate synthase [Spirochaetes bacterium GWE1_32_154]OHD49143.1 MAG: adenylosuccinate synthase [Spirochaetes bacterium GWF1_31_7]OHD50272.1 MAG: adenylosuccinate synthase [Spirochaetes bacterium GWE2_31_10]OHD76590.1 MAG: adenylosuccinate synthase [Spirochaetes bacterium RIFOXYB1_FULL_32_8]HBD93944.1 adenylosuccinate synthase [Spirochaetia bacterium]